MSLAACRTASDSSSLTSFDHRCGLIGIDDFNVAGSAVDDAIILIEQVLHGSATDAEAGAQVAFDLRTIAEHWLQQDPGECCQFFEDAKVTRVAERNSNSIALLFQRQHRMAEKHGRGKL